MSSGGTIINGGCGQLNFTSNQGAFTSPVHQLNQDLSCDYQITVARGTTIKLMFVLMALQEPTYDPVHDGRRCRWEYVKLYDGPFDTLGDNQNADRICGHQEPEFYYSRWNHYIIQFVTKYPANLTEGFKVQWSAVYDPSDPSQRIDFPGCGIGPGFDTPPGDITKRMANGQDADRYSWPSVCRLIICNQDNPVWWMEGRRCILCTGTLVRNLNGNFHVITSASCFINRTSVYSLENSWAYCGFHRYLEHRRHVRFRFIRIISHDDYREEGIEFNRGSDIAVVELAYHTTPATTIPNRSIQAACLPNVGHFSEDTGVGVGWGHNYEGKNVNRAPDYRYDGGYARKLQQVNVTIVDDDKCFTPDGSSHPGYHNGIDICVTTITMSGRRSGQQVGPLCKGDDGGPLLSLRSDGWVIVGVARAKPHFHGCGYFWTGFRNRTDVYVDVFYHRDWINENINYCVPSENCTTDYCVINIFGECRRLEVVGAPMTVNPRSNEAGYALRLCTDIFGNEARLPEADTTSDLDKIYRLSQLARYPVGNMWFGKVSAYRGSSNVTGHVDNDKWLWPSGNRVDPSLWSPLPIFHGPVVRVCTHANQHVRGLKAGPCEGRQSNIVCSYPHTV